MNWSASLHNSGAEPGGGGRKAQFALHTQTFSCEIISSLQNIAPPAVGPIFSKSCVRSCPRIRRSGMTSTSPSMMSPGAKKELDNVCHLLLRRAHRQQTNDRPPHHWWVGDFSQFVFDSGRFRDAWQIHPPRTGFVKNDRTRSLRISTSPWTSLQVGIIGVFQSQSAIF